MAKRGRPGNPIMFNGTLYPSVSALYRSYAEYAVVCERVFRVRMKNGMNIHDALFAIDTENDFQVHGKKLEKPVMFDGRKYVSLHDVYYDALIRYPDKVQVMYPTFLRRVKKRRYSLSDALFTPPKNYKNFGKLKFKGKVYDSYKEVYDAACMNNNRRVEIGFGAFKNRMSRGWDISDALYHPRWS